MSSASVKDSESFSKNFYNQNFAKKSGHQTENFHSATSPRGHNQGMRLPQSSSPRMAKSNSLGVFEQDPEDLHIVDQDDIIGLTQDVKNFSDGLANLKAVFNDADCHDAEELRVLAHERLGEVLSTLKGVLQKYPPLNSTEIFSAAGSLIKKIKNYDYEDHSADKMELAFSDAIDQLALEFSGSVSEYLMGDLQPAVCEETKTKSYDNLMTVNRDTEEDEREDEKEEPVVQLTSDQIDTTLMNLQAGLDLAFQRAKAWSKYLKDVMAYVERRAQLEVEYSKNLSKLAQSMKPALTEEGFLPLQSVYCTVFSQDMEYAKTCQATLTLLQTTKFVDPLASRRTEHDKVRKTLKETWLKEVKRMQEAVSNLRKAQTLYITRQQEYEKAKEMAQKVESDALSSSSSNTSLVSKVDKRKKMEEEAAHKSAEAETTYKACVAEANVRQQALLKVKTELLAALRDQIHLSDQVIKKVTIEYFQLLQTVSAPVPVQYHTLCEASKKYEAGSQYGEFVRRLPVSTQAISQTNEYKFEPYYVSARGDAQNRKVSTQSNDSVNSDHPSAEGSPSLSPRRDKYRVPVKAWGQGGITVGSDTDSASGSSKSLDSSPSNSPHPSGHKKMGLSGSMEDLIEGEMSAGVKNLLAVPGTETVDVQSIMKRQGMRRNTTFGVDFQEQVEHYHSAIPPIILKCLREVERRGINVKGIYRVSGVKSTVENLCQRFEMDPESVSLENENPNVISNVLKLYLRQLPEPLLTFKLYQHFIQVAKENMSGGINREATVEKLHDLIDKLPFSNRKTCGVLMHHLQRVASHCEQNQMNASNLGIVFGPTLLRPQGGNASLACLVDTPHQTRVVELLILSAQSLFGPGDDHQLIPGETAVEEVDKSSEHLVLPNVPEVSKESPRLEIKETLVSSKVVLDKPVTVMVPAVLPSQTVTKEIQQPKRGTDEFTLPGYTNNDKKDTGSQGSQQQTSDGEDNSVESDLGSDDELPESLLPDDSHNARQQERSRFLTQMTPPLSTRNSSKSLPSPASSPSLMTATEGLPEIMVDEVVVDPGLVTASENLVQQLPVIKTWVPRSESLFAELLDSRSPQICRRTEASKTSQSLHPGSIKGSRSSWPGSQEDNDEPQGMHESKSDYLNDPKIQFARSPGLFRKCTSFDLERSKPFPARSTMKSPQMLRKSSSIDEHGAKDNDSVTDSPKSDRKTADSVKVFMATHKELEEETFDNNLELPVCSSVGTTVPNIGEVVSVMSKLENVDHFPQSYSPQIATQKPLHEMLGLPHGDPDVVFSLDPLPLDESFDEMQSQLSEDSSSQTSAESGRKFAENTSRRKGMPKTIVTGNKATGKDVKHVTKSHSGPIMGKAGLKPVKKEGFFSSSGSPKTSAVRSALMTSAARLKAIGRKSPVTLLTYRTDSITVPESDQKIKKDRPSSEPIMKTEHKKDPRTPSSPHPHHRLGVRNDKQDGLDPDLSEPNIALNLDRPVVRPKTPTQKPVHIVTVSRPEKDKHKEIKPKTSTPKLAPKVIVSPQPVTLTVQGMRRSSTPRSRITVVPGSGPTIPSGSSADAGAKIKHNEKVTVVLKTPRGSSRSPVPLNVSDTEKQSGDKVRKVNIISKAFEGTKAEMTKIVSRERKKNGDKSKTHGENKNGQKLQKTDSFSSIHSESSQKSDSSKKKKSSSKK